MTIYKGTDLIAGVPDLSGKADTDLSNINATGKSLVSKLGMPSSSYIDLTLGASGATYTAPATGWITIKLGSTGGWTQLRNQSAGSLISATSLPAYAGMNLPVKKGDTFDVEHPGSADVFRFIYAEGEI